MDIYEMILLNFINPLIIFQAFNPHPLLSNFFSYYDLILKITLVIFYVRYEWSTDVANGFAPLISKSNTNCGPNRGDEKARGRVP